MTLIPMTKIIKKNTHFFYLFLHHLFTIFFNRFPHYVLYPLPRRLRPSSPPLRAQHLSVQPPRPLPFRAVSATSALIRSLLRALLCDLLRVLLRPPLHRDLRPSAPSLLFPAASALPRRLRNLNLHLRPPSRPHPTFLPP